MEFQKKYFKEISVWRVVIIKANNKAVFLRKPLLNVYFQHKENVKRSFIHRTAEQINERAMNRMQTATI